MLPKTNEKEVSSNLLEEESPEASLKKPSTIIGIIFFCRDHYINPFEIENIPSQPKLLAWTSEVNNKISIVELETKQECANFDGMKLNLKTEGIYSPLISDFHLDHNTLRLQVKSCEEIANTKFLVSIHYSYYNSANLEVFDISQKGQTKKIYSFEEVSRGKCS